MFYSLADAHSVADVTSLVLTELPMNTGASIQATQSAAKRVMGCLTNIKFLGPIGFINSTNKALQISDPLDLEKRPGDISFFRFCCTMDAASVDTRITHEGTLSFHFCLQFPQHVYDVNTNTISDATLTPVSVPNNCTSRSLTACFSANNGTPQSTPLRTTTPTTPATAGFTSPVMERFMLAGSSSSTTTRKGCYGSLTFLDIQGEFIHTFGAHPKLLPTNPIGLDTRIIQRLLREYSEKCKLEIFMHLCMLDYVGDDRVDQSLHINEVSRKISAIK